MKIRKLQKDDIKQVLGVIVRAGIDIDSPRDSFETHFKIKKLKIKWTEYIVAKDKKKIVGVCGYYHQKVAPEVYGISWFAVDPEHQKRGIGSLLLETVEKKLKNMGGRKAMVYTSNWKVFKDANVFYKKRGYKKVAVLKDFYQPKEDAIIFSNDL